MISQNTSDGSDNSYLGFAGGGAAGITRGGYFYAYGEETTGSGREGSILFYAGNSGHFEFNNGNVGIGAAVPVGLLQAGSGGTPPLYVSGQNGNIGIGTTKSNYCFHFFACLISENDVE